MDFDKLMQQAEDLVEEHHEKIKDGVDKAGDLVDDKTGGKYSDHVDTGQDAAKGVIDDLAEEG
jgi:hypothetical protein